ncbi:MAG: ABC transporter permease [Acidobacteria bacterium]|nr:ABC transporter permease [Acidobacteriota bacterium]
MAADLDEEMRSHRELREREFIDGGMDREEARYAAARAFGNVTAMSERGREAWGWRWLEDLGGDLRYAVRTLLKNRGFSAIAIFILALGISANAAVFSVLHAVLLRPLPYRDPGRLAMFWVTDSQQGAWAISDGSTSYRDFLEWKREAKAFEDMAIFYKRGWSVLTLTADVEPQKIQGAFVSSNLFSLLGGEPALGRTFTEEESQRRERVVILSHEFWRSRFGGAPDVLGRDLRLNGENWRVVGVMPESLQFPFRDAQLWLPLTTNPFAEPNPSDPANLNRPQGEARFQVIARLSPNATLKDAQAEISTIEARLASQYPDTDKTLAIAVRPLDEYISGEMRKPILLLALCVLVVLLIACSNLATLFLARGVALRKELALRTALGASRWRVVRQLLTESALLGLLGGAGGVLLARVMMTLIVALPPFHVPRLNEAQVDMPVLAFGLVLALICGICFGLVPARRVSECDPHELLKTGQQNTVASSLGTQGLLIATQLALSVVLLASAGLLIRSFVSVLQIDPGFRPDHILTMNVQFVDEDTTPAARARNYYKSAIERVEQLPGVRAAGMVSNIFYLDERRGHALRQVEGRPAEPESSWKLLVWTQVSGNYFRAMSMPLLEGRFFREQDGPDSPPVAIINQTAAKRYWPGEDPIGKRFKGFDARGRNDEWVTVVGLVPDMRSHGLEEAPMGVIYEVQAQRGEATPNLVVRTSIDPSQLAMTVRGALHELDPNAVVSEAMTMSDVLREQTAPRRFQAWLMGIFSALALALAAIGLYGVTHYFVMQRIPEIGLRMALGAAREEIVKLLLNRVGSFAAVGLGAGLVLALWAAALIKGLLFGVTQTDPLSFAGATLLLVIAGLAATYFPVRKATRVDPMAALRGE